MTELTVPGSAQIKNRFVLWGIAPDTLLFVALWIAAVAPGVLAVRGLTWPYDIDGFRDISAAQVIRDGRSPFADVFYPDAPAWYSPLVPIVVAALSWIAGAGVTQTYVQAGPWLNAFAPLAFYACARVVIGRWPALAAAAAFMLLPLNPNAWAGATYTPWLFPSVWAQAFLYIGVLLWVYILPSPSVLRLVFAGVLTGVAFLAHGAPGILLAGIIGVTGLTWRKDGWRMVFLTGITAAVVTSPFLVPPLIRYHFHVVNRAPNNWVFDGARPRVALAGFADPWAIAELVLVIAGAWMLWNTAPPHVRRILLAWGGVAFLLYGYCVATEHVGLPALMPAYHFYFPLRAWKWMLFGCGVVALASYALSLKVRPALIALVGVLAVGALYYVYLSRAAFTTAPAISRRTISKDEEQTYAWLRSNAPSDAVVLASDMDGLRVVGPAGRLVISLPPEFSNPYLPWQPRAEARDRMQNALLTGDMETFRQLQQEFHVTHVFWRDNAPVRLPVKPVFTSGPITLYDAR